MESTEKDAADAGGKNLVGENGFLKTLAPSTSINAAPVSLPTSCKIGGGSDALRYANILRSRNKFSDALTIYDGVLEKDSSNVEAHIGKGICLQMQNRGRLAFESFAEAIRLDQQNACALTHCGMLYKDEGHLVEAADVCPKLSNHCLCG